jgi:hypothetical protein
MVIKQDPWPFIYKWTKKLNENYLQQKNDSAKMMIFNRLTRRNPSAATSSLTRPPRGTDAIKLDKTQEQCDPLSLCEKSRPKSSPTHFLSIVHNLRITWKK